MIKKLNQNNENKLKELTYKQAKLIGQKWQKLAASPIQKNEIDEMGAALAKGIKLNLEIDALRQLIMKINKDKLDDVPISETSEYKYAYYLYLLAIATHNINLINYAEKLKKEVLKRENEK